MIKLTIPAVRKTRAHRVLFQHGTPFKQKVVQSKLNYQRQPKHRYKEQ